MADISLSHSSLQVLQACPLRYEMSRIEGRKRKGTTRGQRRGSAFSDALEHRDVSMIHKAIDGAIMGAMDQQLIDDLIVEREVLSILYKRHVAHFGDDDKRELEFDLPIEGMPGYRNRGRIDGINWFSPTVLQVEEDKLLQMWSAADVRALPMNGQVLRYLGAAEILYPKAEDIRLRYRVTRYPNVYKRKDEGAKSYADRVVEKVATMKADDLFSEHIIDLNEPGIRAAVDRYYTDLSEWAVKESDLRNRLSMGLPAPANYGDACKAYGGCEFLPACKQEPGFEDLYTKKTKEGQQ